MAKWYRQQCGKCYSETFVASDESFVSYVCSVCYEIWTLSLPNNEDGSILSDPDAGTALVALDNDDLAARLADNRIAPLVINPWPRV